MVRFDAFIEEFLSQRLKMQWARKQRKSTKRTTWKYGHGRARRRHGTWTWIWIWKRKKEEDPLDEAEEELEEAKEEDLAEAIYREVLKRISNKK